MNKPLILLQNAWCGFHAKLGYWDREDWLEALHSSHSGRRLARIFPDPEGVYYTNTTPEISPTSKGICTPNLDHVRGEIARANPPYIVACGAQAHRVVLEVWGGRLILMPHPAWRSLTNDLLVKIRELVEGNDFFRVHVFSTGRKEIFVRNLAKEAVS